MYNFCELKKEWSGFKTIPGFFSNQNVGFRFYKNIRKSSFRNKVSYFKVKYKELNFNHCQICKNALNKYDKPAD